jgi:hypothetical protein
MNCGEHNCRQGKDGRARPSGCGNCHGMGYDASGQRCECREPRCNWRAYLGDLVRALLYVLAVMVIAGPTLIMIFAGAK